MNDDDQPDDAGRLRDLQRALAAEIESLRSGLEVRAVDLRSIYHRVLRIQLAIVEHPFCNLGRVRGMLVELVASQELLAGLLRDIDAVLARDLLGVGAEMYLGRLPVTSDGTGNFESN